MMLAPSRPATIARLTSSAKRGDRRSAATHTTPSAANARAQDAVRSSATMAWPSSSVCAAFAMISTPLMPAPSRDNGTANMPPRPAAVTPISTSRLRNIAGSTRPAITSRADTVANVPAGPANAMRTRPSRRHAAAGAAGYRSWRNWLMTSGPSRSASIRTTR
ncbi:hypothetical protein D3C86_1499770 [compost metagenome]